MSDFEAKVKLKGENEVSPVVDEIKDGFKEAMAEMTASLGPLAIAFGGIAGLVEGAKEAFNSFKESQAILDETSRITTQLGTQAGWTTGQIQEFSGEIGKNTGLTQDNVMAITNVIASHQELSGKSLPAITQASIDMAAAMNHGVVTQENSQEAAQKLAKALVDPATGITKLDKTTAALSDSQKALIKSTEDTMGIEAARNVMLQEVQKNVAGAAEDHASLEFQMRQAKAGTEELFQSLGEKLAPVFSKVVGVVSQGIAAFVNWMNTSGAFNVAMGVVVTVVDTVINTISTLVKVSWDSATAVVSGFKMLADAAAGHFGDVKKDYQDMATAITKSGQDIVNGVKQEVKDVAGAFKQNEADTIKHENEIGKIRKDAGTQAVAEQSKLTNTAKTAKDAADKAAIAAEKDKLEQIKKLNTADAETLKEIKKKLAEDEKVISDGSKADKLASDVDKAKTEEDIAKANATMLTTINKDMETEQLKDAIDAADARVEKKKQEDDAKKKADEQYKKQIQEAESAFNDVMSSLAGAMNDKDRTQFEIKKRASEASVLVKAAEAVMNIWSTATELGPIAGTAMAIAETATVGITAGAQISQIEGQSFPSAYSGGYIPNQGSQGTINNGVRVADGTGEVMLPIDNPEAMAKVGKAIAPYIGSAISNQIQNMTVQNFTISNQTSQQLYRGLKNQEKLMRQQGQGRF